MEIKYNGVPQEIASTLKQINESVEALQESQEKMCIAVDGMSKELQELARGEADTNGVEATEMVPVSANLVEDKPVPQATTSIAPQLTQWAVGPTLAHSFFTMQEVSSINDSVISCLLARPPKSKAIVPLGRPVMPNVEHT